MIKVFTILGLVLQFLAFWMAAPEILGVDWLRKTEGLIRKMISQLPQLILAVLGMVLGVMFYHSMRSIFAFVVVIIIIAILLLLYKKLGQVLDEKISKPLIKKLILNDTFRFTLLKFAALFFTLGFIIQIALVLFL
ncbi:hypothetical protein [Empedobacter brevis]|uniref:Uncharacterized protein n=1 Tax=Empedobacter brevis NBRC 14943 = ATCC 43319 TaxID=1218108 RepID=A0A511NLK5_9FLAO|nr:hypothetical protein [Empedobacter brevis]GEM53682.1 hypothetical protein EB1_34720 [Empedobacter brevis NBRC 14943 = ATCC 43319]